MNTSTRVRWLTRNVVAIGLLSLFSDMGHELTTAVLPLFWPRLAAARRRSASSKGFPTAPPAY